MRDFFSKMASHLKRRFRRLKKAMRKNLKGLIRKTETQIKITSTAKHTVDYSSTGYLERLPSGNGRYAQTVKETCRLLGYPLEHDTFFPSDELNIDGMYDRYEKMIDHYLPILGVDISFEEACKKFRLFQAKYKTQKCFDFAKTDCVIWFWDWLLFSMNRGYYQGNYFDFEFYKKDWKVRDEYLGSGYRKSLMKLVNNSKQDNMTLSNKGLFNQHYAEFIHRKWISTEKCSEDEFIRFLRNTDRVFVKPLSKSGGKGCRVVSTETMTEDQCHKAWEEWSEERVIIEEIIKQDRTIATFNESTINTIRIYTFLKNGEDPVITLACGRFGRSGKVTDNFHQGGYGVMIDSQTGTIITDGMNQSHQFSSSHPDSGKLFKGFTYPNWDLVVSTAKKAAKKNTKITHVGWDITINDKNEVELIEGNSEPGFDLPQAVDQIGKRHIYDEMVIEMAARNGIRFPQSEVWFK